jgi:aspartyl-tRNA(Asn)/glutamyl-tRNA(Gln) amidotransferase subunit C
MNIDKALVAHIANLARLKFDENELDNFAAEFDKIVAYVDTVKELPIEDEVPAVLVFDAALRLREDTVSASLPVNEALKNAPKQKDNCFVVPRVVESGN